MLFATLLVCLSYHVPMADAFALRAAGLAHGVRVEHRTQAQGRPALHECPVLVMYTANARKADRLYTDRGIALYDSRVPLTFARADALMSAIAAARWE